MVSKALVWFRHDLRLHDNEALAEALAKADVVVPIYVFDERLYLGRSSFGFPRIGEQRARFIWESVENLRSNLQSKGADLIVRAGKPEEIVFQVAQELNAGWVFCNRERTYEECQVQDALERNLWSIGAELHYSRGKMLYHTQDLPFPVSHTPDVFTQFRKEVERTVPVRTPFVAPAAITWPVGMVDPGPLPEGPYRGRVTGPEGEVLFRGGEDAGIARMKYYFWESKGIDTYKETRNGLLGTDFSSRFSPWLASGCLSPKMVFAELKRVEEVRGKTDGSYWLYFELLWRDFFRLMGKKHGKNIFLQGGIRQAALPGSQDERLFRAWVEGRTGIPLIDANMRELNATGFMSNRGRQLVASFLVKDLGVNWQMGAEYFESRLTDYDPCSNWCNWNYIAGVGNDPREDRYFNIQTQAKKYDPAGAYVRHWIPEIKSVPEAFVHNPGAMSPREALSCGVELGKDYPLPILLPERWAS